MQRALALPVLLLAAAVTAGGAASAIDDCTPPRPAAAVSLYGCSWSGTHIRCEHFPPRSTLNRGVAVLELAEPVSGRELAKGGTHCVLLKLFIREDNRGCRESLMFRNFKVGWVQFAPGTAKKRCSNCVVNLRMMEDVTRLQQFSSRSYENKFWDFSNPVFNAETGSLVEISFNVFNKMEIPCRISLANIQYLGNTSVEKFTLRRNENNSTHLKLGMMPKMKDFRIAYAYIGKFPEDADVQMPVLETLSLRYVGLEAVPPAVAGMKLLETLELSGARLGRLAGQLPPMPKLIDLALDDAGLCCLDEDHEAFSGLPQLEFLTVENNALPTLGSALSQLHNLEFLVASNNSLTEYPQLDIRKPAVLVFEHNRLQTLPDCARLSRNDSILDLDISNNQISSWDGRDDMLRCVEKLNVSYNKVSVLSSSMLRVLDRVQLADLGGNPVHCRGCPLVELQQWLLGTAVQVRAGGLSAAATELRCAAPAVVAGLSVGAAPSSPEDCRAPVDEARPVLALALGLAALAALALAAAALCHRYRFELAYSAHLLRLRLRARATARTGGRSAGAAFLYDAFVLYSGGDRQWVVETLVPLLEKGPQRYRLCLHERDFQLGTVIVQNISSSMDRSRHTIVVLSDNFVSSKWCMWEMDVAHHRTLDPSQREFIILLELEPLERSALPRHLRFLMDTRSCVHWHQAADSDHHQQALRSLKRALGPGLFPRTETTGC
ncbi:toll-like receptor 2 [Schistocerca gregaria]|uniref:toll-like receptor 2 n=1 Tax=Schistocerca gregaria TaxID=7010 RepID=UPI00211E8057|nr:toll-like receptor 2 [Schistocerca gregaria]